MDLKEKRRPYSGKEEILTEDQIVTDPIAMFHGWYEMASQTEGIKDPNAMCLATASKEGRPSARMVLLKGCGTDGFKFFTNYESRKAKDLNENPFASLTFYWEQLRRSVRIEGRVEKLSVSESVSYFNTRPLGSRIGAMVSPQSQTIPNRDVLREKAADIEKRAELEPNTVCKPDNWGGYMVIPDRIEFWQGQTNRLHDRIRFRKKGSGEICDKDISCVHEGQNGWVYERLAP